MRIAVLALQGAFIEHEQMLARLGVPVMEIRQRRDLDRPFDGLILPGGESTVQGRLLRRLGLYEPLKARIAAARERNQLVTAFHPELTGDPSVHQYFLDMVRRARRR